VNLVLTTRVADRYTVIDAVGELDVHTAPRLRDQFLALVNAGDHHLILDLDKVSFLDSTGLGVLVGALKRLRRHGGSLRLVCTRENILKVFRLTGLTPVFTFHPDVDEAVSAPYALV
jgi:anti-sigma B factor antagonist